MAAYIISLFPIAPILAKKIEIKKARLIIYTISILVFVILTIEEIKPFVSASKTYDIYDITASAIGSTLSIISFEFLLWYKTKSKWKIKKD